MLRTRGAFFYISGVNTLVLIRPYEPAWRLSFLPGPFDLHLASAFLINKERKTFLISRCNFSTPSLGGHGTAVPANVFDTSEQQSSIRFCYVLPLKLAGWHMYSQFTPCLFAFLAETGFEHLCAYRYLTTITCQPFALFRGPPLRTLAFMEIILLRPTEMFVLVLTEEHAVYVLPGVWMCVQLQHV